MNAATPLLLILLIENAREVKGFNIVTLLLEFRGVRGMYVASFQARLVTQEVKVVTLL